MNVSAIAFYTSIINECIFELLFEQQDLMVGWCLIHPDYTLQSTGPYPCTGMPYSAALAAPWLLAAGAWAARYR